MRTIEARRRSGVAVQVDATVRTVAKVMERAGVGAVAVLDGDRLVGIVTDRDLVRRALAPGLPADARVDGVMSAPVISIDSELDVHRAFALFRQHPVRRLAVTESGRFAGMITVDDLLIDLSQDLTELVHPIRTEAMAPQHDAPVPAPVGP